MIEIVDKKNCCGCCACMNICPVKAIIMEEDEKGFKYPKIDKNKCIRCGMCEKICPIINNHKNTTMQKVYAVINKNEKERKNSSSGGVFVLLGKEILKRNGVIYGAAFDEKFSVKHIKITNETDLKQLQGSKYVQSDINNIYVDVKKMLDNDKYVLFTGTSCQIEGLNAYLRKEYNKLYTQDIICHGVPSPKLLRKYLDYQQKKHKEKIKNIEFRNKDQGWLKFRIKLSFETKKYSKVFTDDPYMMYFLSNMCLRESCYNCSFKNNYRNSDITLADYWGVKSIHPNMDDDKGTSIVITNSKKGEELFDSIKDKCIYEESKNEYIYKYNTAYIKSVDKYDKYDEFFYDLNNENFDVLVKKYSKKENSLIFKLLRKLKKIFKRG